MTEQTDEYLVVRCNICGDPVNPNSRFTYTKIEGWDRPGKAGGSDVSLRRRLPEFAHRKCIDDVKNGVHPRQETFV